MIQFLSTNSSKQQATNMAMVAKDANKASTTTSKRRSLTKSLKSVNSSSIKSTKENNDPNDLGWKDNGLALFHRHELQLGTLIGTGSFSECYEIDGFSLDKERKLNKKKHRSHFQITPLRRKRRLSLKLEHDKHLLSVYASEGKQQSQPPKYVLKHLSAKLTQEPKLFHRAVRDLATEVAVMSSVDHPHIAKIRGTALGGTAALSGRGVDGFFIVLDRLEGTLDDRMEQWNQQKLQQGPSYYLDEVATQERILLKVNYAAQIATALQYLHEQKIIYRDLKPQNVGFQRTHPDAPYKDQLVLFDFGLSRRLPTTHVQALSSSGEPMFQMSMVGTRRYMAPEVVLTKVYNTKADTYSWALVLFELLSQQRPFDGIQRDEHKEHVCRLGKRPKLYQYYGIPEPLQELLRLGWAQDVSKRLTMNEVLERLGDFLHGTVHERALYISNNEDEQLESIEINVEDSFASMGASSHSLATEQTTATGTSSSASSASSTTTTLIEDAKVILSPAPPTVPVEESVDVVAQHHHSISIIPEAVAFATSSTTSSAAPPAKTAAVETDSDPPRQASCCQRLYAGVRNRVMKRLSPRAQ